MKHYWCIVEWHSGESNIYQLNFTNNITPQEALEKACDYFEENEGWDSERDNIEIIKEMEILNL